MIRCFILSYWSLTEETAFEGRSALIIVGFRKRTKDPEMEKKVVEKRLKLCVGDHYEAVCVCSVGGLLVADTSQL